MNKKTSWFIHILCCVWNLEKADGMEKEEGEREIQKAVILVC